MEILTKLKQQGWHLTEDGLKKLPDDCGRTDPGRIIKAALDIDFRDIAGGALPQDFSRKDDTIPGRVVLQISKIRNISAPKANEESKAAPRFLYLELTDGVTTIQSLEFESVSTISINTPPGAKIYFKTEKIQLMQGYIVLKPSDIQVLGGKVPALVEKWEMARTLQKYAKGGRMMMGGTSGPPPWTPFGQKIHHNAGANDKNFKSLVTPTDKDKDGKENNEFDAMRNEAIAEAAKTGAKKTFGGGNQPIVDHNVKKILEKGYTEEEAKNALKATRNNLERALYNLKRRNEFPERDDNRDRSRSSRETGKRGMRDGKKTKEELAAPSKPAGNVSLFEFLTDKLPTNTEQIEIPADIPSVSTHTNPFKSEPSRTSHQTTSKPYNSNNYNNSKPSSHNNSHRDTHANIPKSQAQASSSTPASSTAATPAESSSSSKPKFENNISSSFANRNSSADERPRRGPPRDSGSGRGGYHGHGRQFDDSERYRDNPRNSNAYNSRSNRASNERGTYQQNSNSGYENNRRDRDGGKDYQSNQRSGYDNKSAKQTTNARYNQKESQYQSGGSGGGNRNFNDNNNQSRHSSYHGNHNNNNNNAPSGGQSASENNHRVNKLVEETSKLKIDKSRSGASPRNTHTPKQHHTQYNQQQQHPPSNTPHQNPYVTQQSPPATTPHQGPPFNQMTNGFAYDPNKIIGFQNKETNEFALTLLKSQGITALPPSPGVVGMQEQQQLPPPQVLQQPTHAQQPLPPQPHPQYMQPPPMQMSAPPFAPVTTFVMTQAPPPMQHGPPAAFGMNPGESWLWKQGDRCLAKYWDDGRYYEAEITGVSSNTCVVFFLGYGNHEEVVKTDCLPITDAQNRPINFSTQPPPPLPPQTGSAVISRGVPNRYRGERQMYVPPPKREN